METLWLDLRYCCRTLLRTPIFTVLAVLTLALGIGANTAIFTLIDAVILRMLPVEEPKLLVLLSDDTSEGVIKGDQFGQWRYFSRPLYEHLGRYSDTFQGICAFQAGRESLSVLVEGSGGVAERARGKLVSGNYFSVLGVNAILGRTLKSEDEANNAPNVAVIRYAYWKRRFGSDASAVGRTVILNGNMFSIVGVMPPDFFGETLQQPPDFWLPLKVQPQIMLRESFLTDPQIHWLKTMGRLRPGVKIEQAEAGLKVRLRQFLSAQFGSHTPAELQQMIEGSTIRLAPGETGLSLLRVRYSTPLHILMGVVVLVLLIACANVASLLLVRATARQREIALRLALGASRVRLIRQLLTEGFILAGLGCLVGVVFAVLGVNFLVSLVPIGSTPLDLTPNARVLGFALGISLLTAISAGLVPALRCTRLSLAATMKVNSLRRGTDGVLHLGLNKGLVVLQVSLSLSLLVLAGLFVRSLEKLRSEKLGYDQTHLLLANIDLRFSGYSRPQRDAFHRELVSRIDAIPGVYSATLATVRWVALVSSVVSQYRDTRPVRGRI